MAGMEGVSSNLRSFRRFCETTVANLETVEDETVSLREKPWRAWMDQIQTP